MVEDEVDHKILQGFLLDGLFTASLVVFAVIPRLIEMAGAGFGSAGVADHSRTTMTTEGFSGEKIIDGTLVNMAGGLSFHALRLLEGFRVDDGGHTIRHADIAPDIGTGIPLIGDVRFGDIRFGNYAERILHTVIYVGTLGVGIILFAYFSHVGYNWMNQWFIRG